MKLLSWKRFRDHNYSLTYELTVETYTYYTRSGSKNPPNVKTKVYRGDMYGWANRETGHEADSDSNRELIAFLRKIEWGDYPELNVK